jgi:NADH-quinone oxidoreductase subunit L
LFLGAGSVINAMHHEQDMRKMGGLKDEIPFTFWMMIVGTLALTGVGLPFRHLGFAGYVSKDAIIEAAYASQRPAAAYAFICVVVAAAFTSFYSWRLAFMTFFGHRGDWAGSLVEDHHDDHAHDASGHHDEHHAAHESPRVMLIPLAVLAFGATFAGVMYRHWFIGSAFEGFWKESLFLAKGNTILEDMEKVPWLVSFLPTLMLVIGVVIAYYMYVVDKTVPATLARANPLLYRFLLNKWYFDELYDFLFVRPAFWIGRVFWKGGDGAVIDGIGPDGVSARILDVTRNVVRLQTGYVYHYAFAMLLGVAALATWFMFGGLR